MKSIIVVIALFYLGWRLGRAALGALHMHTGQGLESFVYETGAGMWLVSLAVYAAGMAGRCAHAELTALLGCLLAVAVAGHARTLWKRPGAAAPHTPGAPMADAWWQWALVAAVAGFALMSIVRCFVPETNFDALAYHLAVPKAYLGLGRIDYLPTLLYSNFPQTAEMLYMAPLALGVPQGAALLHTGFGLLAAALVYSWAAQRFSTAAGCLAAAIFYLNPMVGLESPTTMIDLVAVFYGAGAALLIVAPRAPGPQADRATLCALFAGIALSVKWSCFPVVVLCAGWWLWDALHTKAEQGEPFSVRRLAVLAALCVLPAAPYLFKNILFTGNPIWPTFGGRDMPAALVGAVMHNIRSHGGIGPRSLVNFLRLPWDITLNEWAFGGAMSPVFMMFAPLYALVRKDRSVSRLLLFCALYIPLWYIAMNQSVRLLLPLFPLLAVASAYVLMQLTVPWLRTLAALALAAHLALGVLGMVVGETGLLSERPVLTGRESHHAYLLRTGANTGYEAISWVNRNAGPEDKVMLGELLVNGYYLDAPYVWGHPIFQGRYLYGEMHDSSDLYRALRRDRVTLILFRRGAHTLYSDDPELYALTPAETELWKSFLERYTCIAFTNRDTVVRITPVPGPNHTCPRLSAK